jgi:hypothetical protein
MFALLSFACGRRAVPSDPKEEEMARAAERLRKFDADRRNVADFAHLPTWDTISGADPYAIVRVPEKQRFVGILRGADAVVVLDDELRETERLAAPAAPVAVSIDDLGSVLVAGELASTLARFSWQRDELVGAGSVALEDLRAVRGVAGGPGQWIYLAEEREGRMVALRLDSPREVPSAPRAVDDPSPVPHPRDAEQRVAERRTFGACRGPIRLARVASYLIANCLLDHRLLLHRLTPSGEPSAEAPIAIQHDGPIWSFDAVAVAGGLRIAAGGVEDHPLDRTIGAFGYIDSFLFLYRVDDAKRAATREAAINLSELGVVTPKAIALSPNPLAVTVAGYGSEKLVTLSFSEGIEKPPRIDARPFVPGSAAVAAIDGRFVFANPLFDAWVERREGDGGANIVPVSSAPWRSERAETSSGEPQAAKANGERRLGEALFFTTLMAPFNRADGALSRFTCETCHYEGYVDGRTHHTGRDEVHAVTKPLLGLFNNRPHFSRALDPDLTAVAFNEFRVAGAKSDHDPWLALSTQDAPWLEKFGVEPAHSSPEALRRALIAFLIAFQHRPNPSVLGRTAFTELERQGAETFRDRCENCHEARLASDQPATRVAFDRWESLVMAREGTVVWGKDVYEKTGIVPYVHENGARVPSLRRLYKKHPYFTNGSAGTLDDVLARARFLPSGFLHDAPRARSAGASSPGAPSREVDEATAPEYRLDDRSRRALLGFLQLL